MKLSDFPRLAEFLVRCIDEESLGGLKLRRDQAGTKFIAPWKDCEPLLGPNAPALDLIPSAPYERKFLEEASRVFYGYPLLFQWDAHLTPLFFIQVDVQKQNGDAYQLSPVLKSLGANRLALQKAGLSQRESDLVASELEGDFGSFDARMRAAVEALDLPERLFDSGQMDELPRHTNRDVWCKMPLLFLSSVSTAKKGLRYELARFAEQNGFLRNKIPETALGTLIDPEQRSEWVGARQVPQIEVSPLNSDQAEAVDRSHSAPLTVITGPPGTGKSQVVVNILANCVATGETVLLASNNNKPLDEVRERLADIMKDVGDFSLRLGSREIRQEAKDSLPEKLSRLVASEQESEVPDLLRQLELLSIERRKYQRELDDIQAAQSEIEAAQKKERQATSVLPESWVLHVQDSGPVHVDAKALRAVAANLDRWVGRAPGGILFVLQKLLMGNRLMETMERTLRKLYEAFPRAVQDLSFPAAGNSSIDDLSLAALRLEQHMNWMAFLERRRTDERRLSSSRTVEAVLHDQQPISEKLRLVGQALLRASWSEKLNTNPDRIRDAVERYFDHVERLGQNGRKNREFFEGYEQSVRAVMAGLPVWMVTNLSVGATIPLAPALFDCVVIDEASQSDFASILPLLFRAKRAVLVGDPKQLSHIPGITPQQEQYVASETNTSDLLADFSPISRSAYSLGASAVIERGDKEILLSQHYRCHPDIIGFSNMAFYGQRLVARTIEEFEKAEGDGGIRWHHVDGELLPTKKSAANVAEVRAVVELLGKLFERSRQTIYSVGIVAPFRLHTEQIRDALSEQAWWDSHKEQVVVGTAHTFQGSECDVMIFSPVVTKGLRENLVRFAAHSDELLNVAVTRAKSALHVVGDKVGCRAAGGALAKLVEYTENSSPAVNRRPTPPSEAEIAFAEILRDLGYAYQEEVPLFRQPDQAPYRLDFVYVSKSGIRYDLEVDGNAHYTNERFQDDAIRNKFVDAAGYKVMRFPARDVLNEKAAVRERLRRLV